MVVVSKKLTSDVLLRTAAYETLRQNVQVYGQESSLDDEDVFVASEEESENPSVSTAALVELLSTDSGNENVTQRYRDRAKERRDEVRPDNQIEDLITSAADHCAVTPNAKYGLFTGKEDVK
ncbi:hypothetical protein NPIL_646461 [Nephila pilipes]|uniref:RED-like N-terminal domain-containing protein n=1 Tax=Nephila pilipes TaxID=299642 RepID=A0A8X6QQH0_NEPPI|nr:hypothetical protein NPIL_646461 [Nephila pilipes]